MSGLEQRLQGEIERPWQVRKLLNEEQWVEDLDKRTVERVANVAYHAASTATKHRFGLLEETIDGLVNVEKAIEDRTRVNSQAELLARGSLQKAAEDAQAIAARYMRRVQGQ